MDRVDAWVADADHAHFLANFAQWQQTAIAIDSRAFARPMSADERALRTQALQSLRRQQTALRYAIAVLDAIDNLQQYSTVDASSLTRKYLHQALEEPLRPAGEKLDRFDPNAAEETEPDWGFDNG